MPFTVLGFVRIPCWPRKPSISADPREPGCRCYLGLRRRDGRRKQEECHCGNSAKNTDPRDQSAAPLLRRVSNSVAVPAGPSPRARQHPGIGFGVREEASRGLRSRARCGRWPELWSTWRSPSNAKARRTSDGRGDLPPGLDEGAGRQGRDRRGLLDPGPAGGLHTARGGAKAGTSRTSSPTPASPRAPPTDRC
jgi:hypothetical protein